jgi:DNA N-6-adenine-methyltransferase (Dam)
MNTSFERTEQKDEWLTPRHVANALGPFDLDPCASIVRPWEIAAKCYTITDNGLVKPWAGFVFCNPPYGNQTRHWFKRMAEHNNGIALTFARTETRMFFESVWPKASAVFFIKGRLSFCDTTGKAGGSAGAPSVLIAYGEEAATRLRDCKLEGKFIRL